MLQKLPSEITEQLEKLEGDNLVKDQQILETFVDQHFTGNFAPRESHRVRGEMKSLLETIRDEKKKMMKTLSSSSSEQKSNADAAAATTTTTTTGVLPDPSEKKAPVFESPAQLAAQQQQEQEGKTETSNNINNAPVLNMLPEEDAETRRKNFESQLKSFEVDLGLVLDATSRAALKVSRAQKVQTD